MEDLALKVKLAVLWIFWTVTFFVHIFMGLFEPGVIEQIMAGTFAGLQLTPELMLLYAILILIPLGMAFLSLTLKEKANRWANVVVGIVYTGLCLFDLMGSLAQLSAYSLLMFISHIVVSSLIVWYAYKWT